MCGATAPKACTEELIQTHAANMSRLKWGLGGPAGFFFFFFFFWVTGELSTLRQLMKVPNEPGLSPNNGLENVSLSDQSMASNPRKGQAKCRFLQPSLPDALPAVRMVLAETQAELSPAKIEARLEMPCLRS